MSLESREPGRPSPEEMLARVQAETGAPSTSPGAGRLRIFLGPAPGVGKTYEMLTEAREAVQAGTDVVVGLLETYNRPQTAAQVGSLAIIPRKQIAYGGIVLEEMDTEAVLARRPAIVLVDELAHTNARGSRHEKRYEDVLDLMRAGIDVWTTMNVQHIESLHTTVETITGVAVRETVPDWVLDQADEISLVDVSVDEMHRRMAEGNIYPPAQARMALQNFFRKGNLTALRELALRRTAENVDSQLERYMTDHAIAGPWPASERILVAVDYTAFARDLIRRAWGLARALKAPLLVVHVRDAGKPRPPEDESCARDSLELAEDLGAEVLTVESPDLAGTLARLITERHVTQLVLGKSLRPPWQEMIKPSLTRQILTQVQIDIHLVSTPPTKP